LGVDTRGGNGGAAAENGLTLLRLNGGHTEAPLASRFTTSSTRLEIARGNNKKTAHHTTTTS